MALGKTNSYITADLDFAEEQIYSYRQWLANNPYDKIDDRKEIQLNKKTGGSFLSTVQTKEAIQKAHRDTTKEFLFLLEVVNKLRTAEESKTKETRANTEIPTSLKFKQ